MKHRTLIALLILNACGADSAGNTGRTDAAPTSDAGPTADAADALTPAVDGPPDAFDNDAAVSSEAGLDAGYGADSGPEAGTPDAVDVATVDAGSDARDSATADGRLDAAVNDGSADAAGDAVDIVPICTVPEVPACQDAIATDARVRAAFPGPCTVEYQKQCAGMPSRPVETLPVVCYQKLWRLSGGLSGSQWVPGHQCSVGCASGKLCNP